MNSNETNVSKIDNKKDKKIDKKIDYSNYSFALMPGPVGQPSATMNYWSSSMQYYQDYEKLKP
jgi:hypothetical protein